MVSIVQLQRKRTEAAAAAAARSIGSEGGESRMDFSGGRGELPIPMHTAATPYGAIGGGGMPMELHHDHGHHNGQSQAQGMPSSPPAAASEESPGKKRAALVVAGAGAGIGAGPAVKYRECLKNHAAAIGGNATDGCGEFMPSGEEGSLEALKCSACGCHRNFHRKELDDLEGDSCASHGYGHGHRVGRRLLGPAMPQHHKGMGGLLVTADHYGGAYAAAPRALPPPPPLPGHPHHQIVMPLSMIHNTSESDEMDGGGGVMGDALGSGRGGSSSQNQKRFRTKFSAEQKARMLDFAERVGWRLQKLDDAMVQQFCVEIGVKRRVLKVWMHNNKHNLAKRPLPASPPHQQPQPQPHPAMPIAMQSPPMPMPMPMPMMPVQPSQQPGPSFHRDPSSPPQPRPE